MRLAYYGSPVWMKPCLSHQSWKRLFSQHYRAVRAAVGDWRTKIPRAVLDIIGKRANPRQWAQYSVTNYTIKAYNKGTMPLGRKLKQMGYINDRCPKRAKFFDTSHLKIGRQDLLNRLNFLNLNFDWIGDFSDDYLRTRLKKEFFITWLFDKCISCMKQFLTQCKFIIPFKTYCKICILCYSISSF